MPTWFWIVAAGYVTAFALKMTIKQDCFGMIDVPSQWSEPTQIWFKRGMGAMLGLVLLPVGPIIKDFVSASAHGIERVRSLDKQNAEDLRAALDKLEPAVGV